MKFHIATRLENHQLHTVVRDLLHSYTRHRITYDWTAHGSVWQAGAEKIREVAQLEKRGVAEADYVIVLLPGGRGTHAELGMALALGKPVLMYSPDLEVFQAHPSTCAFYHDPQVRWFGGILNLVNAAMQLDSTMHFTPREDGSIHLMDQDRSLAVMLVTDAN